MGSEEKMAKRILVVDDEELVTQSLLKLLNVQGYAATVVRSGREAVEEIKKANFDLIVCDVRMPQMDGIETIRKIRAYLKESGQKPVPEILITGYADIEKYQQAMDLKVSDYLYKPFDTQEFLQMVKRTIG